MNGDITLAENLADIGGYKVAYQAYQNWAKKGIAEEVPPELQDYSQEQLFWITAASIKCRKCRPEIWESFLILGCTHSPEEFRVNGAFSNIPDFSKDFNCSLGSNMYPKHKCHGWWLSNFFHINIFFRIWSACLRSTKMYTNMWN